MEFREIQQRKKILEAGLFGQKEEESPRVFFIGTFFLLALMFLVIFVRIFKGFMEILTSFFLTSFWK
jgi:hypothetical protein